MTWAEDAIHPALCLLCPDREMQLDPRTHPRIIRLLADCNTPGFGGEFLTFDQNDVFDRVTGVGKQYFGTITDSKRHFSDPLIARTYLDLIKVALDEEVLEDSREDALLASLSLPDVHTRVTSLSDLYSLPIRLTPMTTTCRVPPLSRVKLGIGWSRRVARDAEQ